MADEGLIVQTDLARAVRKKIDDEVFVELRKMTLVGPARGDDWSCLCCGKPWADLACTYREMCS